MILGLALVTFITSPALAAEKTWRNDVQPIVNVSVFLVMLPTIRNTMSGVFSVKRSKKPLAHGWIPSALHELRGVAGHWGYDAPAG